MFCIKQKETVSFIDGQTENSLIGEEGTNLILNCSAHGNPMPSFSWKRTDNKPILLNGANYGNKKNNFIKLILI